MVIINLCVLANPPLTVRYHMVEQKYTSLLHGKIDKTESKHVFYKVFKNQKYMTTAVTAKANLMFADVEHNWEYCERSEMVPASF